MVECSVERSDGILGLTQRHLSLKGGVSDGPSISGQVLNLKPIGPSPTPSLDKHRVQEKLATLFLGWLSLQEAGLEVDNSQQARHLGNKIRIADEAGRGILEPIID